MIADGATLAAADRNFVGAYLKLVEHVPNARFERIGAATAFVTRLPVAVFNGCVVPAAISADELDHAIGWLATHDVPHRFWIRDDVPGDPSVALERRGYQRRPGLMPVMAMRPLPTPPPPAEAVTVSAVEDDAGYDELISLQLEDGMSEEFAHAAYPRSLVADPDVRVFTARLAGRAVGSAIAIRTGAVSGVYAVGTSPHARRRGVGTAVTWAAVSAGRDWGCSMVVLQASDMGLPIYASMGFREIAAYVLLDRPSEP